MFLPYRDEIKCLKMFGVRVLITRLYDIYSYRRMGTRFKKEVLSPYLPPALWWMVINSPGTSCQVFFPFHTPLSPRNALIFTIEKISRMFQLQHRLSGPERILRYKALALCNAIRYLIYGHIYGKNYSELASSNAILSSETNITMIL